jgi:CP family cyanate transporter-like MFS transporter
VGLRLPLLAVPPLLPAIHHDLHLTEKAVGALSGLPILLLAGAAVGGSLLIARLGARRALIAGLCLTAGAGALRGVGPTAPVLFAATLVMGVGIAVSQPALPDLVRQWLPDQVGRATAVYTNGFLIGELAAASLTAPVVLPAVRGSWSLALAAWSVPVLLTALLLYLLTPHARRDAQAPPARWWPDWRDPRTWRLGLVFGSASATYFGTNAFLPDYLRATGHAELTTAALTSVNLLQLPASVLVAVIPGALVARRLPLLLAGAMTVVGTVGLVTMPAWWVVGWAGLLGFASALVFVLSFALPPLLAEAGDVHRLSAAMFTISYASAFVAPLVGGAAWDFTGIAALAFAPVGAAGLLIMLLGRSDVPRS